MTSNRHRIVLLAAGHASVDLYQGAVPAVVPFLDAERHYGYAAVSGIVLAATLLSSFVQPLFGILSDRCPMPWLLPVSMTTAGLGLGLSGVGDSYLTTWLAIALCGLGVAAYHPESARLARLVSGNSHIGMSWFSLGGNIGFALAPIAVTPILSAGGLRATPFLLAPAVLGGLITLTVMRSLTRARAGARAKAHRAGRDDWPGFLRLSGAVICRSIVYVGLSAFVALHVQQRTGGGPGTGASALFVLFTGGAVGTVLGGRLAARWGRVPVARAACLAAIPAVAGVVFIPGPAVYLFVAAAAIALYVPFSLNVTLAQDYLPNRVGTAGGVTLGLAVSIGGVAAPGLGALADATMLATALIVLVPTAVAGWLFARGLTEPGERAVQPGGAPAVSRT
ncbi:MFS transporter [Phytomonospora endophytica]|uniref:FSR family fosmidomycin resistance protein-like MFS transporter n=1 Tax=Phytomonospora endophytica TaxID=714109 RepID=A0A841FLV9_9ACTN|nr:MFS transporter [Phytomonospora endophytica]MBB6035903.1 FSR family fosmidomycin resistance protein-like MFS transporter [Phytomonospora endophytica]GIG71101.1 MFS transporter [Phytomonospora endophytica]